MRNLKLLLFVPIFMFGLNLINAQSNPLAIAVITKAKWCSTCKKNGDRVNKEVLSKINLDYVKIVVNDLSDKNTKAESVNLLATLGLIDLKLKSTGIITFFNAVTKEEIKNISMNKTSAEIFEAFDVFEPK